MDNSRIPDSRFRFIYRNPNVIAKTYSHPNPKLTSN